MTFGEKIKELRQKQNLSQSDLGEKVDVHYSHIGKYESNASLPSVETMKKLAIALEVSIDYLLFDESEKTIRTDLEDSTLLYQFKKAESLPKEQKKILSELIDAFLVKNDLKKMVV